MDSDNSNRKTSYFHAQKILDAAADIKTKKVEEWGLRRYKMIPYTWKSESIQKKNHMYLYTQLGFTQNDPPHQFVNILCTYLVHYVVLISKYLDLLISKSLQFFF